MEGVEIFKKLLTEPSVSAIITRHDIVVSTVARFAEQTWTSSICAALNQSTSCGVPATFHNGIGSGRVRESMQVGTCPRWTSTSPTTFHVCSFAYGPGVDRRGCPPHPSPT